MTHRLPPYAVAAALLLAAAPLRAQAAPAALPDTGARVRIARGSVFRVVGTLVARDHDRWAVRTQFGDTVVVAAASIRRVDVSTGTLSRSEAFMRTARPVMSVLATATLVATVATEIAVDHDDGPCMALCFSDAGLVATAGAGATLYGGLIAGIVGLSLRDRWTRVDLPAGMRLGVVPTATGAAFAVRLTTLP